MTSDKELKAAALKSADMVARQVVKPAAAVKPAIVKDVKKAAPKKVSKKKKAATSAKKPVVKKTVAKKTKTKTKIKVKEKKTKVAKAAVKKVVSTKAKTKPNSKAKEYIVQQSTETMENMMTQGKVQFDKLTQDAAASGKEQMDAVMKSANIFMKGFEDVMKTYMTLAQDSAEKNAEATKALLSCKDLNELTETQSKLAQNNFDNAVENATKLSELGVKLTTEAFEPINDQLSKSIKKASESMAA